ALGIGVAHATDITGAGSSFVYPVISKWSASYAEKTGNRVNYQSIGSGGGIGGILPAYNIGGIAHGKLVLDGQVLANIFLAQITNWSDPAIAALNPDIALPSAKITVVHRSDGSGTTFNFS